MRHVIPVISYFYTMIVLDEFVGPVISSVLGNLSAFEGGLVQ